MIAYFLTAGFATRFRPHSNIVPKPLLPFLGIPMLAHTYEFVRQFAPDTLLFNLHHLADKQRMGTLSLFKNKNLIFLHENKSILGSGGAVINAKDHLIDDFMLINGDEAYFPKDLAYQDFYTHHKKEQAYATLLTCEHPEAGKKFGAVWVDQNMQVTAFGKTRPDAVAKPLHFLGASLLNPDITKNEPLRDCNILYDLLGKDLGKKKIITYNIKTDWFELGNCDDLLNAQNHIAASWLEYSKNPLLKSLLQQYHSDCEISNNGKNVLINASQAKISKFSGFCYVGKDVKNKYFENLDSSVVLNTTEKNNLIRQIIL